MWRATCLLYPELDIYRNVIKQNTMHCWWSLTKAYPYLRKHVSAVFSVLMGCQPRGFQCFTQNSLCVLCSECEIDSATHVLFICEGLKEIRDLWWNRVINSMPPGMVESLRTMNSAEKLVFIISGLRCDQIIPEWIDAMVNIAKFVFSMYQSRKNKFELTLI